MLNLCGCLTVWFGRYVDDSWHKFMVALILNMHEPQLCTKMHAFNSELMWKLQLEFVFWMSFWLINWNWNWIDCWMSVRFLDAKTKSWITVRRRWRQRQQMQRRRRYAFDCENKNNYWKRQRTTFFSQIVIKTKNKPIEVRYSAEHLLFKLLLLCSPKQGPDCMRRMRFNGLTTMSWELYKIFKN